MGTVVTKLYGQNLDEEIAENIAVRMQDIFLIEEDLSSWKMSLPEKLRLRPWENFGLSEWSQPHYHPVFARLSVVTQLRYLNVRILLHRPVLSHLLWSKRTPSWERNREKTFTEQTWNLSVIICQDSAVQIIDIIHRVTESMDLLGAWWYSVYFSECLCMLDSSPAAAILNKFTSFQCGTCYLQPHSSITGHAQQRLVQGDRPSSRSKACFGVDDQINTSH